MIFFLGCAGSFAAGFFAGKMPTLIAAVAAGAGGILLGIFVVAPTFAPNVEWSTGMKIAFPLFGALGAVARFLITRRTRQEGTGGRG